MLAGGPLLENRYDMQMDLVAIETRYRAMSPEEFSCIKRSDLTADAAGIYDREVARRLSLGFHVPPDNRKQAMGRLTFGKGMFIVVVACLASAYFIDNHASSKASRSSSPTHHAVGDTTTVVTGDIDNYPCGSTPAALDEIIKWSTLKDSEETARTIIKTDSTVLPSGTRVKVLDYEGLSKLKVRMLGGKGSGVECWVSTDWLN